MTIDSVAWSALLQQFTAQFASITAQFTDIKEEIIRLRDDIKKSEHRCDSCKNTKDLNDIKNEFEEFKKDITGKINKGEGFLSATKIFWIIILSLATLFSFIVTKGIQILQISPR